MPKTCASSVYDQLGARDIVNHAVYTLLLTFNATPASLVSMT
jgi:hypothetical protein